MDEQDRAIINLLQDGFPVCARPYLAVAEQLGMPEQALLARLRALLEEGYLTRFGPMYHAERMGGALTLAALEVPEERFEEVAEVVNGFEQVAHNYRREHRLNMWFVLATETIGEVEETLRSIEKRTGLMVYDMPKEREFHVGLRFHV